MAGPYPNTYWLIFDGNTEMWRRPRDENNVKRDCEDELALAQRDKCGPSPSVEDPELDDISRAAYRTGCLPA